MIEPLEPRVLFSFSAHVNFEPMGVAVPNGYARDTGSAYGVRGGGPLAFGWNADNSADSRVRKSPLSADVRYDTLIAMQVNGSFSWELAVPDGTYSVHIVAGDAGYTNSVYKISAEGVPVVNGVPTAANHWVEGTQTILVTEGRLTVSPGAGASNDKIDFIDVTQVSSLDAKVNNALAFAQTQLKQTVADLNGSTTTYVRYTQSNGTWVKVDASDWTAGFLPGSLWQMYSLTGDSTWKTSATNLTLGLQGQASRTYDVGFNIYDTFEPLYAATGNATYKQILINAANSKMSAYNAKVGAFQGWNHTSTTGNPNATFSTYVDLMMDSELLFWASKQTGDPKYYNAAVANAAVVQKYLMRPDGSTIQFGFFNASTGAFVDAEQYQGYSNTSTWSRGQAWGIYGFATVARDTGHADSLATAKKMADWFISHLPSDKVPYWDFNDPAIPNAPRDSSAAAIAASGLLILSKLVGTADATRYRAAAAAILNSLTSSAYLAQGTTNHGILLHGASFVPQPNPLKDNALVFGDYYFIEAMRRYKGLL